MFARSFPTLAIALVLLTASPTLRAQVDEESELDKARNAYLAHQYDEADSRFRTLLDAKSPVLHDRVLVNQAHMYWGAVLMARKQPTDASEQFEELLLVDPVYEPDPLAFPTDVVNAFIDTRARLRDRLNAIARDKARREVERRAREEAARAEQAHRIALLEKLAGEEKTIKENSRWIALVPFGVGQFQNGQRGLGWAFLGTEVVLATTVAITIPIYLVDLHYRDTANNSTYANEYLARAQTTRFVNIGLNVALLATAAIGILQAQVAFVPEEAELVKRPVPQLAPRPTPAPSVSFHVAPLFPSEGRAGGAFFGLDGRF